MNIKVPIDYEHDNYGYIFHLLRIANNYTLKDIEKEYHMSQSYISVIENHYMVSDKMLKEFCYIYDISRSQLERIHNTSKVKYKWNYQKTLNDIMEYYVAKNYFKENC